MKKPLAGLIAALAATLLVFATGVAPASAYTGTQSCSGLYKVQTVSRSSYAIVRHTQVSGATAWWKEFTSGYNTTHTYSKSFASVSWTIEHTLASTGIISAAYATCATPNS